MKKGKSSRFLLLFIIFLKICEVIINLPSLEFLNIKTKLSFRKGLDLAGGTSLTYKADMSGLSSNKREEALNSAKTVIDRRVNLFGVSEPLIQTAVSGDEYRIIVELPGINIEQAKNISMRFLLITSVGRGPYLFMVSCEFVLISL